MDQLKQTGRDIETETRKHMRDLDGHDLGDDLGNAGDEIKKDLGNVGDEIKKDVGGFANDLHRSGHEIGRELEDPEGSAS